MREQYFLINNLLIKNPEQLVKCIFIRLLRISYLFKQ